MKTVSHIACMLVFLIAISGTGLGFDLNEVKTLANKGDFEEAISKLEIRLSESPADLDSRHLLGNLLMRTGEAAKAVDVWSKGLGDEVEDEDKAGLLWQMGHGLMQMGGDGPNAKRIGGVMQFKSSPIPEGGEVEREKQRISWMKNKWNSAADAFQKIHKMFPEDERLLELIATCLSNAGKEGETLNLWKTIFDKNPEKDEAGAKYGRLLLDAGKIAEAKKIADKVIENSPFSVSGFKLQTSVFEVTGDKEKENAAKKSAQFYEWLPPFSEVEFTDKNYQIVSELQKQDHKSVAKLLLDKSDSSSGILAAICYWHMAHGGIENTSFKELEKRKEGDLLIKLLKQNSNTCTMKQSLHALARMKYSEALEFVKMAIPQDTRPVWNLDAAGAAIALGNEKIIPTLIEVAGIDFSEKDRALPEAEASFLGHGPLMNRFRAINALGYFDTPESRAALTEGLKNPEIKMLCEVSLYRISPTKQKWKNLEKGFSGSDDVASDMARFFAAEIPTEEGKALKKEIEEGTDGKASKNSSEGDVSFKKEIEEDLKKSNSSEKK